MRRLTPWFMLLSLTVLAAGCSKQSAPADASKAAASDQAPAPSAPSAAADTRDADAPPAALANTALTPVVTSYLEIGALLASDKTEGVAPAVDALSNAIGGLATTPKLSAVQSGLASIKTDDLEAARAAFVPVSEALIATLDADPSARAGLIHVLCPMAFASKGGRWVQRTGDIKNPYEGSRMLACGAPVPWQGS